MKNKILIIVFLAIIIMPSTVLAASIDDLKDEGKYTFKSIPPTNEEESWIIFELFSKEYPMYNINNCNATFTVCDVTHYGDVVIDDMKINYDYDADFKTEVDKLVQSVPTDLYFTDMEYFSYLIYGYKKNPYTMYSDEWGVVEDNNISIRYNYSTELRKYLNYKNFEINPGMGYDDVLSSFVRGYGLLKFNDTAYGILMGVSVYSPHVVYLDNNTTDIPKAIKDRLTTVFGSVAEGITIEKADSIFDEITAANYSTVSAYVAALTAFWTDDYNSNYDYLKDDYATAAEYIDYVFPEKEFLDGAEEDIYTITINDVEWQFVVKLDSSKVNNSVSLITSDVDTDITISTNNANVPLDAMIQAKGVTKTDLKDKIGTENYHVYDISLYSKALGDYVKELSDGSFKVSIPIPSNLNGKTLMVYYVATDGTIEKHEVTPNNGYAEFVTNHFSEYILAEAPASSTTNNPATLDDILTYVAIMAVSAVGIVAVARVLKKKSSK